MFFSIMPVLLSIFDSKVGPVPYISIPESFNEALLQKTANTMNYTPNIETDDVLTVDYNDIGIKSVSLMMTVPSKLARGNKEMLQIAVFTTEAVPRMDLLKRSLLECKEKIMHDVNIYLGFYHKTKWGSQTNPSDEVNKYFDKMQEIMRWLDDAIKTDMPQTEALIVSIDALPKMGMPPSHVNRLRIKGMKNVFVVFKGDENGTVMMRAIPVELCVIKVLAVVKQFTIDTIKALGEVINLPLLFTNGLCHEITEKCSYEAYFTMAPGSFDDIRAQLEAKFASSNFVERFEITEIAPS